MIIMRWKYMVCLLFLAVICNAYASKRGAVKYQPEPVMQENMALKSPFQHSVVNVPVNQYVMEHSISESSQGLSTEIVHLHYALAADVAALLTDKKNGLLSEQGRVQVEPASNSLWIMDKSATLATVKKIIQRSDVPVKQIQIDARIVNMSQEGILDLGIRLGAANRGQQGGSENGDNAFSSDQNQTDSSSGANQLHLDFGLPFEPVSSLGLTLAKLTQSTLLDMELTALESEDKAQLISNPHLIATNQKVAIIESGEEIPFQETTVSGATSVTFKKAVLRLKVLPQIMPDNRLLMLLDINQDSPSGHVINGVPAIVTKAIHTQVLVNNGQTIVLGGIYKQDKSKMVNQAPFLGDIPMIGNVFKNLHRKVHNEELLIFITPRIIAGDKY